MISSSPLLYESLTRDIISACFSVSNELGSGFLEEIYQTALGITLQEKGICFISQARMNVFFRDKPIGIFYADFLIEEKVILEIKAVSGSLAVFQSQVINYLKASNIQVGLLVNFGKPRLEWNRLEHPDLKTPHPQTRSILSR